MSHWIALVISSSSRHDGIDTLEFRGGISLIEVAYRHAAQPLVASGVADRSCSAGRLACIAGRLGE